MKVENSDVVIVGSGVAGLICALSLDKNFKIIFLFLTCFAIYEAKFPSGTIKIFFSFNLLTILTALDEVIHTSQ